MPESTEREEGPLNHRWQWSVWAGQLRQRLLRRLGLHPGYVLFLSVEDELVFVVDDVGGVREDLLAGVEHKFLIVAV